MSKLVERFYFGLHTQPSACGPHMHYADHEKAMAQRDDRIAELERENADLRATARDWDDHYTAARAEIDRLNAQWERLVSDKVVKAAAETLRCDAFITLDSCSDCVKTTTRDHAKSIITAARDAARREG